MKRFILYILATIASVAFVPVANADSPVTPVGGYTDSGTGLFYKKSISKPNKDGQYTITLEAFVKGELTISAKAIPSDIVLVLDVSSSMAEPKGSTTNLGSTSLSYDDVVNGNTDYFVRLQDSDGGYYWEKIYGEEYNGRYYLYARPKNKRYLYNATQTTSSSRPNTSYAPTSSTTNIIVNRTGLISGTSRITALQNAVKAFLTKVDLADEWILDKDGNKIKKRASRLNNQVAIVKFANSSSNTIGISYDNNGQNYSQRVTQLTPIENSVSTLSGYVDQLMPAGGTNANNGMVWANSIFSSVTRESNKAVVFFSDGEPDDYNAIGTANTTKNTHNAVVYTVGTFTKSPSESDQNTRNIWRFMNYVSSNYPNATGIYNGGTGKDDGFYIDASGDVDLTKVFEDIAGSVSQGTEGEEFSEGVSTVDVVSASFTLPAGVTEETIASYVNVYTSNYTGGEYNFDDANKTPAQGVKIGLGTSEGSSKKDRITVEDFDFFENWCGPDQSAESGVHGKKLIITIPIEMDKNAVGGPNVATNGPGTGIYVNGKNRVPFEYSPKVSLPVNIHIRKQGLDVGESAKFTIWRTHDDPDSESAKWEPVTSVFVTRHYDNDKSGVNAPITKVVGMPSTEAVEVDGKITQVPFVYRVTEDEWSWSYSSVAETAVTSNKLITNPFIFTNSKKTQGIDYQVRHAESKATNTFNTGGKDEYDDSKYNGRTVIGEVENSNQGDEGGNTKNPQ